MTQNIIDRITQLCDQKNISINKMLEEALLSKSLIDNLKKNSMPSLDKIVKVANYFNVSVDYIAGRTEIPYICETKSKINNQINNELYITPYKIYRNESTFHFEYPFEYKTYYSITINNKEIPQSVDFIPPKINTNDFRLLNAIIENEDTQLHIKIKSNNCIPLIVTKDDNKTDIIYMLKITEESQAQFENFIKILKYKKIIPE